MASANYKGKCICQICSCGRCRCPPSRGSLGEEPKADATLRLKSEYQSVYETFLAQERRKAIRPPMRHHTSKVPIETSTMYKNVYKAHPVVAEIRRPKREYIQNPTATDHKSTYMGDFEGQPGKRSVSFRPNYVYKPRDGSFPKDTSYTETFTDFVPEEMAMCRSRPMKHSECLEISNDKMDTSSVMKTDFVPHAKHQRTGLIRPPAPAARVRNPFKPETTYKMNFIRKTPEHVVETRKPAEYVAPQDPFEGHTTFRSDYQAHPNDYARAKCFKPNYSYHANKIRFDGKTTSTDAYKAWPVAKMEKPAWAIPKPTNHDADKPFSQSSSYQDDFVKPEGFERSKLANPGNKSPTLGRNEGQDSFHKKTQYKEQYCTFENVRPPKSFKINQEYETPAEQMSVESTYRVDFVGKHTAPASLCVPTLTTSQPRRPLTFKTTYEDTFKGERPTECPAQVLAMKEDNKKSADMVKNGHHYFVLPLGSKEVKEAVAKVISNNPDIAKKVEKAMIANEKQCGKAVSFEKETLACKATETCCPPERLIA